MVAWFHGRLPLSKTSYRTRKTPHERRFGKPLCGPIISSFGSMVELSFVFCERLVKTPPVWQKWSYLASSLVVCEMPGGIWKTRHYRHGRRGAGTVQRVRNPCSVKLAGRAQVLRTSTLTQEHPARGERAQRCFSRRSGRVSSIRPTDG